MKILKVIEKKYFFVETDSNDFGGDFRRGENGYWEQRMGESWETVYDDAELEKLFNEWMMNFNNKN